MADAAQKHALKMLAALTPEPPSKKSSTEPKKKKNRQVPIRRNSARGSSLQLPKGLHCMWSSSRQSNKKKLPGVIAASDSKGTTVRALGVNEPHPVLKKDVQPEEHRVGERVQVRQLKYSELHLEVEEEGISYWYNGTITKIIPSEKKHKLPTYVVKPDLDVHEEQYMNAQDVRRSWWQQHQTMLTSDGPMGPTRPEKEALKKEAKYHAERNSEQQEKKRNDPKEVDKKNGREEVQDLMT